MRREKDFTRKSIWFGQHSKHCAQWKLSVYTILVWSVPREGWRTFLFSRTIIRGTPRLFLLGIRLQNILPRLCTRMYLLIMGSRLGFIVIRLTSSQNWFGVFVVWLGWRKPIQRHINRCGMVWVRGSVEHYWTCWGLLKRDRKWTGSPVSRRWPMHIMLLYMTVQGFANFLMFRRHPHFAIDAFLVIPQNTETTNSHNDYHETPGRQIKQSNQLSLPHQDDCNTRMDIK